MSITNNLQDFFEVYQNLSTASNVVFSIGVSPSEVQHPGFDWEQKINDGLKKDRVVAIGETGLDYFRKFGDKSSQVELFIAQLEIAESYNLPVVIHNRKAGHDIQEILKSKLPGRGGVLHCYSEDWDYAAAMLEQHDNLYFSFAGNVTYRNARNLHDTVRNLPWNGLLSKAKVRSWFRRNIGENGTNPCICPPRHRLLPNCEKKTKKSSPRLCGTTRVLFSG